MQRTPLPFIDPKIEYVGVSKSRTLTGAAIRELRNSIVFMHLDEPIAVMIPYETYVQIQNTLVSLGVISLDNIQHPTVGS